MVIHPHQVNNVLKVYSEQLRHGKVTKRIKNTKEDREDRITISAEAKRRAIAEKLTTDMIEKIAKEGKKGGTESFNLENRSDIYSNGNQLTFKIIDEYGESTKKVSIEDLKS